ncbi:hypothetical protein BaRGS_00009842 [Batillaria attramentaria]|uniref:Uncharacterized protein n=1 Tax=Batillaria attramentaria TaxID=370345 RepID=A0ABD0LH67_9CAEN
MRDFPSIFHFNGSEQTTNSSSPYFNESGKKTNFFLSTAEELFRRDNYFTSPLACNNRSTIDRQHGLPVKPRGSPSAQRSEKKRRLIEKPIERLMYKQLMCVPRGLLTPPDPSGLQKPNENHGKSVVSVRDDEAMGISSWACVLWTCFSCCWGADEGDGPGRRKGGRCSAQAREEKDEMEASVANNGLGRSRFKHLNTRPGTELEMSKPDSHKTSKTIKYYSRGCNRKPRNG